MNKYYYSGDAEQTFDKIQHLFMRKHANILGKRNFLIPSKVIYKNVTENTTLKDEIRKKKCPLNQEEECLGLFLVNMVQASARDRQATKA